MSTYVEVKNIRKTIKGKKVLDNISLYLEAGCIHGIFGRNGSGKTMLIRAISGLMTVDDGIIKVGNRIITENRSFPESMGLMIEKIDLWKDLSAFENLKMIADIRRLVDDEMIKETIKRVGLDPEDKRRIKTYSLGMRQKLVLAQAIMEAPELLLLDEPTNGLDEESVGMFQEIMLAEKKRGATILIATHQKEDIKQLCDRVFRIADGKCSETVLEEW